MDLQRLEFTLTTKCNSQCIHCQAEASPFRNDVMKVKDAHNYLDEATAVSNIESFMVFGGEPMLYPKRAIAIFRKAHQLRVSEIEIITNGIWGKNEATAEKLARKLKVAGLNTMNISVDAFHLPHIPLDCPRNVALASLKVGIERITWNVAVIESRDATNEYDRKTDQILKMLEPIGLEAHVFKIVPMGRAIQNLHQYFKPTSPYGPCEGEPLTGNTLTNPESLCIEPLGSVNICWNLAIGNAKQKSLSQMISEYDWRENLTIKTLVEEGPTALLKLPEVRRCQFQVDSYINKCHLCIEIRKSLKRFV